VYLIFVKSENRIAKYIEYGYFYNYMLSTENELLNVFYIIAWKFRDTTRVHIFFHTINSYENVIL